MLEISRSTDRQRVDMIINRKQNVKFIRDNYLNQKEKDEKKNADKMERLAKKTMDAEIKKWGGTQLRKPPPTFCWFGMCTVKNNKVKIKERGSSS